MEAALVSAYVKTLAPKIFTFFQENHELRRNLEHDIECIQKKLRMIATAIEEYDRHSWSDGINVARREWIKLVRVLAYDIEDCIDRFMHRMIREPEASSLQRGLKTKAIRTKFATEIQRLKKKSEDVSMLRERYIRGGVQPSSSGASAPTYSDTYTPPAERVGMEVPRDELLELLREGQPNQLKVISIVGFGGLGKTLLAEQVYDSVDDAGMQYEPKVWVRSAEKGAGHVLKEILEKLGNPVLDGNCDVNKLSRTLRERLEGKKFLIVIDDMRTEYWDLIKNAFPAAGGVGSRVIVTTAIHSIANACSSVPGHVYKMTALDDVDSKRLFSGAASLEDYPPGSEAVLKKCDGLPLALVTTARFLQSRGHLTTTGCENLCKKLGELLETEDTLARMKHELVHNYTSLQGHGLKACLLYLGIFPSGRPVRRKRLIRRWLAEGLVQADHPCSYLDVADKYFQELVNRSIIQPIDVSNNAEVKTCQTHGMMLEFILHKSMCEDFITLLYDQAHLPDKIRRLSIHHNSVTRARTNSDIDLSLVRSLTIFGEADKDVLEFCKYELLRVLDLEECEALKDHHVKEICNLLLLKYLSLGGAITMLPKEISKLKFLETLDLRRTKVKILPIQVITLPCLVHLFGMFKLEDVGQKMSELQAFLSEKSNMHTLAGFVTDNSQGFPQLMDHMNKLTKVKIWCESTTDASSNLTHLSKAIEGFIQKGTEVEDVRSLSLNFERSPQDFLNFSLEDTCYLGSLKLNGNIYRLPPFVTSLGGLTELCLSSSSLLSGDVLGALRNVCSLRYLKLIASHLGKFVIQHGELKSLKRLCIVAQSMADPEIHEGALPGLESLRLLYQDLNGLGGIRIEGLRSLKEVALHEGVSDGTKDEWKAEARNHPRQPNVMFVKKEEVDQTLLKHVYPGAHKKHVYPDGSGAADKMEAPISASLGAMGPLLGKLDVLLAPGCRLPKAVKHCMQLLKDDLEKIGARLQNLSEVEGPPPTAMRQVRELSYDIEDYIDNSVWPVRANNKTRFVCKISPVEIFRRPKRLKWHQQMKMISEFRSHVQDAIEQHERYELNCCTFRRRFVSVGPMLPTPYEETAELVIDGRMNEFVNSLANDGDQQLKVVSIVGPGGLGKTTLAKMLYNELGGQFDCRAFVRVSRKPDMKRLFCDMLSQVQRKPPPDDSKQLDLLNNIKKHLQDKRYLIIIDDLWAASVWDIIDGAFPKGGRRSRIITTTQIEDVALTCCCYRSEYVFAMTHLDYDHSRKLFCNRLFGYETDCPQQFKEVLNKTLEICGGLPLATVNIASLLASQPVILLDTWNDLYSSLSSDLRINSTSERMRQVLNISFNNLPHHLKTCLLYLNMYPEGHTICKDDLVKQWVAEGFIDTIEGRDMEKVAGSYFDELIDRRFIQPIYINYSDEVLSCTVHDVVHDLIASKSVEENFIVVVDCYRNDVQLSDKVRRLSVRFGNAKYEKIPAAITTSHVHSLTLFGLFNCMPSITEFKLLRVLNLQLSGHRGGDKLDLTGISELFQLRYLKIACDIFIELPHRMRGLQYLETLDMDTQVTAFPWDIIHLPRLLYLRLPVETNLSDCNIRSVSEPSRGKVTSLRSLHLTCSTPPSDHVERNMEALGSLLGVLGNLKTLALVPVSSHKHAVVPNASKVIISWADLAIPLHLQRFEWLHHCCIFHFVPNWIGKLDNLCVLKIAVRVLLRDGVDILKGLPALTSLSLYVQQAPFKRMVFDNAGFLVLKYFKFTCCVPLLKFEAGAMPNLQKLKLRFDALRVDQHGNIPVGIEHLLGLKEISAKIGGAGVEESGRMSAKSALSDAIGMHLGSPKVNIQCVDRMFGGKDYKSSGTQEEEHMTLQKKWRDHGGRLK